MTLSFSSLLLVLTTLFLSTQAQNTFNFVTAPIGSNTIYGRVDSFIFPVVAPIIWEQNGLQSQVSSYGTWLLFGTQPDVDLTTNYGANFTTIAGSSAFTWLGNPDWENDFGTAYGAVGCAHRNTFNRFYYMGNGSSITNGAFNWATMDGSTWLQVLDNATIAAWTARANVDFAACVVTASDVVLSVGGSETLVLFELRSDIQSGPVHVHALLRPHLLRLSDLLSPHRQ